MADLIVSESSFALTLAHNFLRDCRDENPATRGVERFSAELELSGGVYRQSQALTPDGSRPEVGGEDALIALLDGEGEDEETREETAPPDAVWIDPENPSLAYVHGRVVELDAELPPVLQVSPESMQGSHVEAPQALGMGRSQARLHSRARIVRRAV